MNEQKIKTRRDREQRLRLVRRLEELLLSPSMRGSPKDMRWLLADGFIEFGASGRVWRKPDYSVPMPDLKWEIRDFNAVELARNVILVTYRISTRRKGEKKAAYSLRSSIWKLRKNAWQIHFHQGTRTTEW